MVESGGLDSPGSTQRGGAAIPLQQASVRALPGHGAAASNVAGGAGKLSGAVEECRELPGTQCETRRDRGRCPAARGGRPVPAAAACLPLTT